MSLDIVSESYPVACHSCKAQFDAVTAEFCDCLSVERSLRCPHCGHCFCKASLDYKQRFWTAAPQTLWDRKAAERKAERTFEAEPNLAPDAVKRPLVLIVDDEREVQRMAIRAVDHLGYGRVLARDGAEGYELAKLYRPDLVLSDALMPKLDGRQLSLKIKQDPELRGMKVVIMTSLYTNPKYKVEGLTAFRADEFLAKPLEFEKLKAVLEKYLKAP